MRETFAHHIAGHVAVMERNELEISGHKGSFERTAGVPCSCLGQQTPLPQAREGAWGGAGTLWCCGQAEPTLCSYLRSEEWESSLEAQLLRVAGLGAKACCALLQAELHIPGHSLRGTASPEGPDAQHSTPCIQGMAGLENTPICLRIPSRWKRFPLVKR